MKELKVFSYIRKYRVWIVLTSILMGLVFYAYFARKQSYTAQAIIQYTNPEASTAGTAPDGTPIDTSEIYSTEVMTKVFEKLGLSYNENNMDQIRANITVEPILSEEEAAVQTALNEQGEMPAQQTTTYLVSYTAKSKDVEDAQQFASDILSAMLKAYTEVYAENHVSKSISPNAIAGLYNENYDYIEMVELLENSIGNTMGQLSYRSDLNFRSAQTGYSFADLSRELALLQKIGISNAYAYVLSNRVTKDQDALLAKYENRIQNKTLSNEASGSKADGISDIIASYVTMMRRSGNTGFTFEYILEEVNDNYYQDLSSDPGGLAYKNVDVTTEYDRLMTDYVNQRTDFEETLIDIAYNNYILDVFSGVTDESHGVSVQVVQDPQQAAAGGTLTFDVDVPVTSVIQSTPEQLSTADTMIRELTDRLNEIYQVLEVTNAEYNQYAGAENLSIMTDTITTASLNLLLYALMAIVLFGLVGCVLAVVLGRLFDVFEYYVYTDKKLNVANRAGCDRYMERYAKRALTADCTCVAIKMTEINFKNVQYGRTACDDMIQDFTNILRKVFPEEGAFIAVNGLGQFVVFLQGMDKNRGRAYMQEVGEKCEDYNLDHTCRITYVSGISSADSDGIYEMRKLMVDSMRKASERAAMRAS